MKQILVIDDEEGIVEEIRDFFVEEGYDVLTATSGERGIELLRAERPHLMLLDLKLPDMNGLAVLKVAKEIHPTLKVVVETGYVNQSLIDQAEALGRDVFLVKPLDLNRLKEIVDHLLLGVHA